MAATNKKEDRPPVVCVFCASSTGNNPIHLEVARTLGRALSTSGCKLVYGGGTTGLMGEVARTVVSLSGPKYVHGIIPEPLIQLEKDSPSENGEIHGENSKPKVERVMSVEELERLKGVDNSQPSTRKLLPKEEDYGLTTVVQDMHTRKQMMADEVGEGGPGSGFVALAGGYGTWEEAMEMVTWNQLNIHELPVVLVNVDGYYDALLELVRTGVREGFVRKESANLLSVVDTPDDVLAALREYKVGEGGRFPCFGWKTKS